MLTTWKISTQEIQTVTAIITGNAQIGGTLIIGGVITIDGANNRISSSSGTIDFDANNLTTTGNISAGNIATQTATVTDSLTANHVTSNHITSNFVTTNQLTVNQATTDRITSNLFSSDTITANQLTINELTLNSFAGTHEGLLKYNTTGTINRFDFPTDTNAVLTGGGAFKNLGSMVAPYTGWQWYDTVLVSTAPVVAVLNDFVVGNRMIIGALRMSNGSAVDSLRTARQFAMEARKIFIKSDTVNISELQVTSAPGNSMAIEATQADTILIKETVQIGRDTSSYAPPLTGTVALKVNGNATFKGDIAVRGNIEALSGTVRSNVVNTNTITTNDLHVVDSIKIGNSIYIGGIVQPGSGNNRIYSDDGPLLIQSQNDNFNTIFQMNNTGRVGIGTDNPQAKLHIYSRCTTKLRIEATYLGIPDGCAGSGSSIWDMTTENFSGKLYFSTPNLASPVMTMQNNGNVGIGTTIPQAKLDVNGHIRTANGPLWTSSNWHVSLETPQGYSFRTYTPSSINGKYLGFGQTNTGWYWTFAEGLDATANNTYPMKLEFDATGNNELTVCGTIRSLEWVVDDISGCDFVFENNYALPILKKRMDFTKNFGHLMYIQSSKDMQKNGAEMANTTMGILRNVEEHELYLYQLNERDDSLEKKANEQEQEIQWLKQQIHKLMKKEFPDEKAK